MPRLSTAAGTKHYGKARGCVRACIRTNAARTGIAYLKEIDAGLGVKICRIYYCGSSGLASIQVMLPNLPFRQDL